MNDCPWAFQAACGATVITWLREFLLKPAWGSLLVDVYECLHRYVHTYIYIHTHIHVYMHTYIHTYIRTYVHTYIRTYMLTYMYTYIQTYIYTHIHTYTYIHTHTYVYIYIYMYMGTAVAQPLRCCATNRKVAGSIPDGVNGIFLWHPYDRTTALGSTQPLTEMSTRSISWG